MESQDKTEAQEIEDILKDEKVQDAIKLSSEEKTEETKEEEKQGMSALAVTIIISAVCIFLYFLLEWKYFPIQASYIPALQKIVLGFMFASFVLVLNRLFKRIVSRRIADGSVAYNLRNIINLFSGILIFIITLSLFFTNWYATMVSFGVVSLIVGLALQNPLSSFFGWIYLLIRKPYEVGDRIRIGAVYGDVINVGYLDTTLWEFRGDYLTGDHPSGRIIKFSNSRIFNEYIYNYSWPLFPFIWKELSFFVSYDTDLQFAGDIIRRMAEDEIGEAMMRRVKRFKDILAGTLIDELEVKERPTIILKAHTNGWIEVTLRYLSRPKNSEFVKTKLFQKIIEELLKHPDKIGLPNIKLQPKA
ncbi:mechanosensitive ion channel family protein [Antarcticibacterium flavum]|uniref:Mechanosensitive ion channel family protein n=1 Tax=Antarcticibacterium flavum TaxID=2058175 RepID=A0A5B7WYZ3_9FLAO|nr:MULTISPECIES: mechanosensitive ion channel family protein [Antarcticibacterium]MCM4161239.1 mechanosensitive ion channel protein MscS [Antarcticibacterium sp. W02-3]QCY68444.1 mechanosensitive ion channel family protein [Antarcticibacterium flavum]